MLWDPSRQVISVVDGDLVHIPFVTRQECRMPQLALSITLRDPKMSTNVYIRRIEAVLSSYLSQLNGDIVANNPRWYKAKFGIYYTSNGS